MNLREVNKYVKDRGVLLTNKQVMLTEPIFVFKKVKSGGDTCSWYASAKDKDSIANLVIPTGAIVNLAQDSEHKMRASQAYCYSIAKLDGTELDTAYSTHDRAFEYNSGKKAGLTLAQAKKLVVDAEKYLALVRYYGPSYNAEFKLKTALECCKVEPDSFDLRNSTCAPGIHFFLDLKKAKAY
jgi:hypothetical protein